jgi:hypothetical protein
MGDCSHKLGLESPICSSASESGTKMADHRRTFQYFACIDGDIQTLAQTRLQGKNVRRLSKPLSQAQWKLVISGYVKFLKRQRRRSVRSSKCPDQKQAPPLGSIPTWHNGLQISVIKNKASIMKSAGIIKLDTFFEAIVNAITVFEAWQATPFQIIYAIPRCFQSGTLTSQ